MKKLALLLLTVTSLVSCSQEPYAERHRFENQYYLADKDSLDNLKVLYPDDDTKVYLPNGELNVEAFEPISHEGFIEFSGDTLFVKTPANHLYYDGDKTANQNWKRDGEYMYLKMNLPIRGEHLLSLSILNWD